MEIATSAVGGCQILLPLSMILLGAMLPCSTPFPTSGYGKLISLRWSYVVTGIAPVPNILDCLVHPWPEHTGSSRSGMFSSRERKLKENLTQGIKYPIIARLFHYLKQLLFHFVTENPFTGHILSFNSLFDVLNITEYITIS